MNAQTSQIDDRTASVAEAVRQGLTAHPKRLPSWLFYDEAGSRLFEQITELPEYYLTRTERGIFTLHAAEIIGRAAAGKHLRVAELGAGTADKTQLLLQAAVELQGQVVYEPVDVSASALEAARERIEAGLPGVRVLPRVEDYTRGLVLSDSAECRLVLYIGSSIGNFDPAEAAELLSGVRRGLKPGDCLLLGVDLVKPESVLLPAYNDAAGVTAAFNLNLLERLNRELGARFEISTFTHRALWNSSAHCVEMHLFSPKSQKISIDDLGLSVDFLAGESIHTENSYKYLPGQVEALLTQAGFEPEALWTDEQQWFAVHLARVPGRLTAPGAQAGQ